MNDKRICHIRLELQLSEKIRSMAFDKRVSINKMINLLLEKAIKTRKSLKIKKKK